MSHSSPRMGDLLPNTHSCCPPSSNHPQQNLKADIIIKGRWKIWCLVNKKCSQIYSLNLNLRLCAYVWFTKDAERGKETNLGFFLKKNLIYTPVYKFQITWNWQHLPGVCFTSTSTNEGSVKKSFERENETVLEDEITAMAEDDWSQATRIIQCVECVFTWC